MDAKPEKAAVEARAVWARAAGKCSRGGGTHAAAALADVRVPWKRQREPRPEGNDEGLCWGAEEGKASRKGRRGSIMGCLKVNSRNSTLQPCRTRRTGRSFSSREGDAPAPRRRHAGR